MNPLIEGFRHITDLEGYDHMLYLTAMSASYFIRDWKKVFLLATAFTLGHSLTLALAAFQLIRFSSDLIELLIPITIVLTALSNLTFMRNSRMGFKYAVNAFFGLIHGMGFSSYFRMMFGDQDNWVVQLLAFNIGVELGQLLIVTVFLVLAVLFTNVLKVKAERWTAIVSAIAIVIASWLIYNKL